jgi:hypothetical protein
MNNHHPKGGFMSRYLNPSVVLRFDFITTYLAVMFLIYWFRAVYRLKRISYVFWMVWESRNKMILRRRRASVLKKLPKE